MYAILNFSAGWVNSAELERTAKAINALICGSSLASVASGALAASTTFNLAKSFRKADNVDHFWIRDTDNICHAPCDTPNAQNKYLRFSSSSMLMADLGVSIAFAANRFCQSNLYQTSTPIVSTSPVNIHIHCTKRCVVVGLHQEGVRSQVTIVSEFTYDLMPYMDDNTGTYIPAAISGLLGYSPEIVSTGAASQHPWRIPAVSSDHSAADGAPSYNITSNVLWRIGNCNVATGPLLSTIGDSRHDVNLLDAEPVLPFGLHYSTANSLTVGSVTDKSDIWFINGVGYPYGGNNNRIPSDVVISIGGKDYVVFDKILIPFV